jgi:MerR family transcriptional regulator, copper efflux regulator
MKIGQLASLAGVSVRVWRHYEAQDLIRSELDSNGYREYPSEAIEIVKAFRTLLDRGFSTRQIREIPLCIENKNDGSAEAWAASVQMHHSKLKELDSLIEVLQRSRHNLLDRLGVHLGESQSDDPLPPPRLKVSWIVKTR